MAKEPGHEIAQWDGETGEKWVRYADALDRMLSPYAEALLETAGDMRGRRCLDVGCGAGALCLELGGRGASVVGADVSRPLLALAEERATRAGRPITFKRQDAATFEDTDGFDLVLSRFGVMFFEEPVAAFANLRALARPGGRLVFTAWRAPRLNPWASLPARLAEEELGLAIKRPEPGEPGPFSFSDRERMLGVLDAGGWRKSTAAPLRLPLAIPGESVLEAARFLVELGPVSRRLEEAGLAEEPLVQLVAGQLAANPEGGVTLPGDAWLVTASA